MYKPEHIALLEDILQSIEVYPNPNVKEIININIYRIYQYREYLLDHSKYLMVLKSEVTYTSVGTNPMEKLTACIYLKNNIDMELVEYSGGFLSKIWSKINAANKYYKAYVDIFSFYKSYDAVLTFQ